MASVSRTDATVHTREADTLTYDIETMPFLQHVKTLPYEVS
jgi:hypothetical protein